MKIDHIDWIDEENREAIVSVTDEFLDWMIEYYKQGLECRPGYFCQCDIG